MREIQEKLNLCKGTDAYDVHLNQICLASEPQPFFGVLHPELLPYVGENYEKTRILLVGESHYVKAASEEDWLALDWYHKPLPTEGKYPFNKDGATDWFDTREVLVRYMKGEGGRGHTIFSRPAKVLLSELKVAETPQDIRYFFSYFSFMNFFQRPALEAGKTINDTNDDRAAADEILLQVIDILQPSAVVFLSKKAYHAFTAQPHFAARIESVSHPTCHWWYRKRNDGLCAADDFRRIICAVLYPGELENL